jgi:hypothetical protein
MTKLHHHVMFSETINLQDYSSSASSEMDGSNGNGHGAITSSSSFYKLVAVVVHVGQSIDNGHYIAYVRRGKRWYLADDRLIIECAIEDVLQQQAYILFYERYSSQRQLALSSDSGPITAADLTWSPAAHRSPATPATTPKPPRTKLPAIATTTPATASAISGYKRRRTISSENSVIEMTTSNQSVVSVASSRPSSVDHNQQSRNDEKRRRLTQSVYSENRISSLNSSFNDSQLETTTSTEMTSKVHEAGSAQAAATSNSGYVRSAKRPLRERFVRALIRGSKVRCC